ncbi:hypothetical protein E4U54_005592 [Claviceps lovelessii]|nr:hypothetical protein E4U54_005592 [Claviceps lovelessii]
MPIFQAFAPPFFSAYDPEVRRQLAGPVMTKEDILLAAGIRAEQLQRGAERAAAVQREADDEIGRRIRPSETSRAREMKAAKAREQRAKKAREQKEQKALKSSTNQYQYSLAKCKSPARGRRSERFVALPSGGLMLTRSHLAEVRRRAMAQFGCRPGCRPESTKNDTCSGTKASTSNTHNKDKPAATKESTSKPLAHSHAARRASTAAQRRTKSKRGVSSTALCLC